MDMDNLNNTEKGAHAFGSSGTGISPKWLIMCPALQVKICFLNTKPRDNSYFDQEDIHTYTTLHDEVTMRSSAMIAAIKMQTME